MELQIRGCHPLWQSFPASFSYPITDPLTILQPHADSSTWFGLAPLRSPLLGGSRLISFPSGTEMFHFPEFAPTHLSIQCGVPGHCPRRVSPFRYLRIIGCLAPPRSLSQLTTSFIACRYQGIHLMLFLTCSLKNFLASLFNCK